MTSIDRSDIPAAMHEMISYAHWIGLVDKSTNHEFGVAG